MGMVSSCFPITIEALLRDAGFSTFPKLVLGRIEADFLQLKGHVAAFFKLNSRSYRAKKVQAFFFSFEEQNI